MRAFFRSCLILPLTCVCIFSTCTSRASQELTSDRIKQDIMDVNPKLVTWRRHIHQNPELSNRELQTSKFVAKHLRDLGLEVRTGIAHTGVVGVLRGYKPGPVIALRADMDALPITELTDVPFRSKVKTSYNGKTVGVMHACGHDMHVAILMGAAEILSSYKKLLSGTIVFIFQPAEEGPPEGEEGGAEMMIAQNVLSDPKVDAIFGLHVVPNPLGSITYRAGPTMASEDTFMITVTGKQTHGAIPWEGVDPIVLSSQIVTGLQTIVSRQTNLPLSPSIITVGAINGGIRHNIIPQEVKMIGTIRTFDPKVRVQLRKKVAHTAQHIAESGGGHAKIKFDMNYGVTTNDPELTKIVAPAFHRTAGEKVSIEPLLTASEDFSAYQKITPGVFFFLGAASDDPEKIHPNHSPYFYADERALPIGVQAFVETTLEFMRHKNR